MSSRATAAAHLAKAREFLAAAEATRDLGLHNAATSNAATAGINAKDVVCLVLTGRSGKTENHTQAIAELKRTGPAGRDLAGTLERLLRLKPKSQYQALNVSAADAARAVGWAARMVDGAHDVLR